MKKVLFLLTAVVFALTVVSCKKEVNPDPPYSGEYGVDGKTPLPEAVDLGITVNGKKVLWASFNLGTYLEYRYGDYYAWGEKTAGKKNYTWATYSFAKEENNGMLIRFSKYCPTDKADSWCGAGSVPDGLLTLLPEDDVVREKLGGNWRMPRYEDFDALLKLKSEAEKDNSDYLWEGWTIAKDASGKEVKDAKGKPIHGLRITRISTGASVFFPAAGYAHFDSVPMFDGLHGCYWSASVQSEEPDHAFCIQIDTDASDNIMWPYGLPRYDGFPIRPVCVE